MARNAGNVLHMGEETQAGFHGVYWLIRDGARTLDSFSHRTCSPNLLTHLLSHLLAHLFIYNI